MANILGELPQCVINNKRKEEKVWLIKNMFIFDAYTSREKAEEIINGYNSGIVTYANENCGFTTIVMPFGEKIKFEIAEIEVT